MTLAQRIQEIRSAAGPLLRDAPGMSGYIAKIDGICHDVQEVLRERDLAVAHDRQPYPTADAYERTCAALEKHRARAEKLEAALRANMGEPQQVPDQRIVGGVLEEYLLDEWVCVHCGNHGDSVAEIVHADDCNYVIAKAALGE